MGLEIAIAAADFKMGRSLFLWNSIAFLCGLILKQEKLLFAETNLMVYVIFCVVGICSMVAYVWFATFTKETFQEFTRDGLLAAAFVVLVATLNSGGLVVCCAGLGTAAYLTWKRKLGWEWLVGLACGLVWIGGAAFYLYMPLAGMTIPPMQWGYPRTVKGFFHALTRGQYEKAAPIDFFAHPLNFFSQIQMFTEGVVEEFNWVYALLALVPFLYFSRMQKRERAWVIGITAIYLCLGGLLLILLNPPPDRQARGLIRVFFTASHVMVAMAVGYGLTLIAATLATHYERARRAALLGGLVALDLAVFALAISTHAVLGEAHGGGEEGPLYSFLKFVFVALTSASTVLLGFRLFFRPPGEGHDTPALTALGVIGLVCSVTCLQIFPSPPAGIDQSTLAGFAKVFCWLLAVICFYFASRPRPGDDRMTMLIIGSLLSAISLGLTFVTILGEQPKLSGIGVFFSALQKSFRPDQYALPVIATMILVGSAVIFLVATTTFKKRAPMVIVLCLFAAMPLHSFMSHWFDNEQRGHLFGYWFGHDMFTPPFRGPDGKFSYDPKLRAEMMKDPAKAKLTYPEMTRDAILYGGTDPGRFCPTYMIFCESFIPPSCKPLDPNYDRRDVYIITQNALADGTYLNYIRSHYNRSAQHDMPFFQELLRPPKERDPVNANYETNFLARTALALLDRPLTQLGADIEARRRREGVYPPKEMLIATPDDSQRCFQEYLGDAQKRKLHDEKFPNEPPQVKPGEYISFVENRVQVSGQVAVMAINGLLTKVMFDKNPTNEFFVEESFPLDWMYPHLTPFGIIMKINRQPLPMFTEEIYERDHEFWAQYSERLIGNWITYDTPVKEIADFVEKVYRRHDFSGFKGDRKFVRDDQAQKAFSKLRSSIGGVYAWRLGPCPPEYRPKTQAEAARLLKEVDFTFRQALAFCPYSPEAVFRYVQLLAQYGRFEDALLVAETCLKLDPYNAQVKGLVANLRSHKQNYKQQAEEMEKNRVHLEQMEAEVARTPTNYQAAFNLASTYAAMQRPDRAAQILDRVLNDPNVQPNAVVALAQAYASMTNWGKLEATLERLVKLLPNEPDPWYDLASLKAVLGKAPDAVQSLTRALELNALRRATNAAVKDLQADARTNPQFAGLRALPEFQKLVAPK